MVAAPRSARAPARGREATALSCCVLSPAAAPAPGPPGAQHAGHRHAAGPRHHRAGDLVRPGQVVGAPQRRHPGLPLRPALQVRTGQLPGGQQQPGPAAGASGQRQRPAPAAEPSGRHQRPASAGPSRAAGGSVSRCLRALLAQQPGACQTGVGAAAWAEGRHPRPPTASSAPLPRPTPARSPPLAPPLAPPPAQVPAGPCVRPGGRLGGAHARGGVWPAHRVPRVLVPAEPPAARRGQPDAGGGGDVRARHARLQRRQRARQDPGVWRGAAGRGGAGWSCLPPATGGPGRCQGAASRGWPLAHRARPARALQHLARSPLPPCPPPRPLPPRRASSPTSASACSRAWTR